MKTKLELFSAMVKAFAGLARHCQKHQSSQVSRAARTPRQMVVAAIALACGLSTTAGAAINGTVFRDFNANGTKDLNDPGIGGIAVKAYNASNTIVGTATSSGNGSYSLTLLPLPPAGNKVRIEFSNLPSHLKPGPAGSLSLTTVTFAQDGDVGVDLGLANPADYCQTDPLLATPCYVNGNPLATTGANPAGNQDVLFGFPYSAANTTPSPSPLAKGREIGATWGLAYQRRTGLLFAAAVQKRHAGFGPGGTGAIYKIDRSGPTSSLLLDVNALYGANTAGNNPHAGSILPDNANAANHDPDSFYQVGKIAFGDIDIAEGDDMLYAVSLRDKTLYQIDIGGLPGTNPGLNQIRRYPIPNPGCADGDFRPWATRAHDGLVYVGVVCSAEASQVAANLQAHVLVFTPAAGLAGAFSGPVFSFPLTYPRGDAANDGRSFKATWLPWINDAMRMRSVVTTAGGTLAFFDQGIIYPQPILSDIEFDEQGRMIIGLMDRFGHQSGRSNFNTLGYLGAPIPNNLDSAGTPDRLALNTGLVATGTSGATSQFYGMAGGDILCAAKNNIGAWVLESNANCGASTSGGANNLQGPGNGEYFWGDAFTSFHQEITLGGLLVVLGKGEVAVTMYDPLTSFLTGGVGWLSTTAIAPGTRTKGYQVFADSLSTFGKAAGVGDLEALCDPAPIEIGNRVWNDLNHNGIQDPNEPGLAGVTVSLYNANAAPLVSTVTDGNGQYLFNKLNVAGGLTPNTAYLLAIAPSALTGSPTLAKAGNNVAIDSDGVLQTVGLLSGKVVVALTTRKPGDNDHRYDFGFFVAACNADNDDDIDKLDLAAISRARATTALPGDPRDANGDGVINAADVKACIPSCTRANCATQ